MRGEYDPLAESDHGERVGQKSVCNCNLVKAVSIVAVVVIVATVVAIVIWQLVEISRGQSEPDFSELKDKCSHVKPITPQEFAERRAKLLERMSGIEAYVFEAGPNLWYYTGIQWSRSERPFLLVVQSNGNSSLILPKFEEYTAREKLEANSSLQMHFWYEGKNPSAYEVFKNLVYTGATVNVAFGDDVRFFIQEGIASSVQIYTAPTWYNISEGVRQIKSNHELEILGCANNVTKTAIRVVSTMIKYKMKQSKVASLLSQALTTAGLTNTWHLVLFGKNAAFPHGTQKDSELTETDIILIDTGGDLLGYQSDISRTFAIDPSKISREIKDAWNTVRLAQNLALRNISAGVQCKTPDETARNYMGQEGYGYRYGNFTHRLGHGIGIQGHEEPYLVEGNTKLFEPGMVFSVEPGLYLQNKWGIRIEDIVYITEDGKHKVFGPLSEEFENPFQNH